MKKTAILTSALLLCSIALQAQYLKSGQIDFGTTGPDFRISAWTEGNEWSDDDNFFISRIKPKARFTNPATQINQTLIPWWDWDYDTPYKSTNDYSCYSKKIVNWIPYGFSYSYDAKSPFEIMPNGIFNSEVFTMWQYISTWGTWSDNFMRMPGNFADVAHKNGVAVVTESTPAYAADMTTNGWGEAYIDLGGTEENRKKVLAWLDYYGIDGIGYNSEFAGGYNAMGVKEIVELNKAISQHFDSIYTGDMRSFSAENIWYDGERETGGPAFDTGVNALTEIFFGSATDKKSSFFLNYNWNANFNNNNNEYLPPTIEYATQLGRNPFDIYASVNLQGKEPKLTGKGETNGRWQYLTKKAVSIGIWSGHDSNAFWEDRNGYGSSPMQVQHTYQKLLEHWFTNSYYNPVYAIDPQLVINESLDNALNSRFFGMSKFVAAQSTLSWNLSKEAFVSYFNVGNGCFFNYNGERENNAEWYNIGTQDYLPTWRWWWSREPLGRTTNDVPTGLEASFAWNDAWFGGSSLRIVGNEKDCSVLHLFKTQFDIAQGDIVTIRYKINKGTTDCSLLLGTGSDCATWSNAEQYIVTNAEQQVSGVWTEKTFTIASNEQLSVIALQFANAQDIDMNIGEISIRRGTYQAPDLPTITAAEILSCHLNGIDAKVIFDMNSATGNNTGHYNIDHNASLYNIYARVSYGEGNNIEQHTTLMGATTSWAALFFSAPLDVLRASTETATLSIGVAAVGVDMRTQSEIVWSEELPLILTGEGSHYQCTDDVTISSTYITPNESFSVSYKDVLHPAATEWRIVGPYNNPNFATTDTVVVATSTTQFEATVDADATQVEAQSLPYGFYDLIVVDSEGEERLLPSFIQIYDKESIKKPTIQKFVALDTDGDLEAISEVASETAAAFIIKDYNNEFYMVDANGDERDLNETNNTLPGAGIKTHPSKPIRLHYAVNSNAEGSTSKGIALNHNALGIMANQVGIKPITETITEGSGWDYVKYQYSEIGFSVSFWIKMTDINYATWLLNIRNPEEDAWPNRLWGWTWSDIDEDGYLLNTAIRSAKGDNYVYNYVTDSGKRLFKFEKGTWYHITYVFKENKSVETSMYEEIRQANNQFTLYINGQPLVPASTVEPVNKGWLDFDPNATIGIGGIAGKGRYAGFDAVIDNFRIYNKALSADEVSAAMQSTTTPDSVDGLVGYWDFENTFDQGYPNSVTNYPDAKLLTHYYPADPADDDYQGKIIVEAIETIGYTNLAGETAQKVKVVPTFEIGRADITYIADNQPHEYTEVEGEATATTDTDTGDTILGYADITFPDPGEGVYKIYTVALNIDNQLGSDTKEYRYIYVANIDGKIQSGITNTNTDEYITSIYPNPFTESLSMQFAQSGTYTVQIVDLNGAQVATHKIRVRAGREVTIKPRIAPGVYIALISQEDKILCAQQVVKK